MTVVQVKQTSITQVTHVYKGCMHEPHTEIDTWDDAYVHVREREREKEREIALLLSYCACCDSVGARIRSAGANRALQTC